MFQYLKGTFVNIRDFVAAKEGDADADVRTFTSAKELSNYTRQSGKIFPLKIAKRNPILRWMLIELR